VWVGQGAGGWVSVGGWVGGAWGGGNPWIKPATERVQSALEWCEFPLQLAVLRSQGCAPVLSSSTLHDGGGASDEAAAANAATLQAAAKTQRDAIMHLIVSTPCIRLRLLPVCVSALAAARD
jgi:hypothetical protein